MDFCRSMRKPKKKSSDCKAGDVSKRTKKKKKEQKDTSGKSLKNKKNRTDKSQRKKKVKKIEACEMKEFFDLERYCFKIETIFFPSVENRTATQKATFEAFCRIYLTAGIEGLLKEYAEAAPFLPNGYFSRTIFDVNTPLKKNRYKDVICNDMTRVVLKDGRPGDYIHANYVRGLQAPFILTQGPMKETVVDFWRMIVQEKVSAICMLCEVFEDGKQKCELYYPESPNQTNFYGDFSVSCESSSQSDSHTVCTMLIVKNQEVLCKLAHYKIISWPDKTVAKSNLAILRTHRMLRLIQSTVVVHCSAGIGRTGTFVAIELGIQLLMNGKCVRIVDLVKALRHCRMNSCQMDTQFMMIAQAMMECGKAFNYVEDPVLTDAIEVLKKQINDYVTAHPPPPPNEVKRLSKEVVEAFQVQAQPDTTNVMMKSDEAASAFKNNGSADRKPAMPITIAGQQTTIVPPARPQFPPLPPAPSPTPTVPAAQSPVQPPVRAAVVPAPVALPAAPAPPAPQNPPAPPAPPQKPPVIVAQPVPAPPAPQTPQAPPQKPPPIVAQPVPAPPALQNLQAPPQKPPVIVAQPVPAPPAPQTPQAPPQKPAVIAAQPVPAPPAPQTPQAPPQKPPVIAAQPVAVQATPVAAVPAVPVVKTSPNATPAPNTGPPVKAATPPKGQSSKNLEKNVSVWLNL